MISALVRAIRGAWIANCRKGLELGVDYAATSSCYDPDPDGRPCGLCDSCLLRAKGFAEAGVEDPLLAKFRAGRG
jgi:7-cyano-7-deazaguanine synthase